MIIIFVIFKFFSFSFILFSVSSLLIYVVHYFFVMWTDKLLVFISNEFIYITFIYLISIKIYFQLLKEFNFSI
jgi:hypothetical protein